jgi:hypothetical protein
MGKTRKHYNLKKQKKVTRRQSRKIKVGGQSMSAKEQAIKLCDIIINQLKRGLTPQTISGRGNTETANIPPFHHVSNEINIRPDIVQKYKDGFTLLVNHMKKKQSEQSALKSFGKMFTREESAPYEYTLQFLNGFNKHIGFDSTFRNSSIMIKNSEGSIQRVSYGDIKRLIKRFEKIESEIQQDTTLV